MYSSAYPGLDDYWREVSYDQINLMGSSAHGWYTLPRTRSYYVTLSTNAMLNQLAQDCTAAADADIDFTTVKGINMMFNDQLDGYAWGGSMALTLDGVYKAWRDHLGAPMGLRRHLRDRPRDGPRLRLPALVRLVRSGLRQRVGRDEQGPLQLRARHARVSPDLRLHRPAHHRVPQGPRRLDPHEREADAGCLVTSDDRDPPATVRCPDRLPHRTAVRPPVHGGAADAGQRALVHRRGTHAIRLRRQDLR